jgi:hypothetical protein
MQRCIDRGLNLRRLLRIDSSSLHSRADESGGTGSAIERKNALPGGDKEAGWTAVIRELKFHGDLNVLNTTYRRISR